VEIHQKKFLSLLYLPVGASLASGARRLRRAGGGVQRGVARVARARGSAMAAPGLRAAPTAQRNGRPGLARSIDRAAQ
jgi:hypothetical protein